ncbi:hypothetical protein L7F22_039827 [Adiantum nelumboides]|nr:hypothetical protein [Adiantum nelumboides]
MTSNFWRGLFQNLGTKLNFSSAYHPQTDGQSEIANSIVWDLLKAYVMEVDQRNQWEKYLPLVEYAYNNTVHTSTGKTPFEVIEGRAKVPPILKMHGKIFAADEYSRDLRDSFAKIKEAISIAQQKHKAAADKHRRPVHFSTNDWVLLKFPKARLRHTTGKSWHGELTGHQKYYAKLARRYYGPFQILKPINETAYQLKLPSHWPIHNAFHVSLLKAYKGDPPQEPILDDPPEFEGPEEILQPEHIIRHEDKVLRNGKNLRSDFEMKFIVDVGKYPTAEEEELSEASRAKIEAAVAELQNRIQKKADVDDLDRITQSTQNVKDTCEKMESNMIELQSQLKRLSAGSRRASRVSLTGSLIPPESQLQMFMPQTKLNSLEDLNPQLLDGLTKDLKEAIEKHNKELEKVQKDFGLFGRSILKLSGHQEEQSKSGAMDPADKLVKIFEGFGDGSPLLTPSSSGKAVNEATFTSSKDKKESREAESTLDSSAPNNVAEVGPARVSTKKDVLVGTVDLMDDDAVVQAIDEALKANKFEPKENSKTIARLCQELEKLTSKLQELDTVMPSLKDGLALKAEKRDLQKLARFVKEQLERPENAIFTGKPLYGFKCMSCDHSIEKLSRVTGDHKPTNRMPPQILPMLSAERIFSLVIDLCFYAIQQVPLVLHRIWLSVF